MNKLDTKFNHHSWYKGQGLTKRQAIEGLAESGDIYLSQKTAKSQSNNLFDKLQYDDILTDRRSSYRLSQEEKEYYLERKAFWESFRNRMNAEYEANWMEKGNTAKGYDEWLDYSNSEKMKVSEYASYMEAFNRKSA